VDGALGGFSAVTVRGDFAAQRVSFIDDGVQLFLRELRRVHVVSRRKNAATGAGLDDVGAVFVREADGIAGLVGAVDHAFGGAGFMREQTSAEPSGVIAVSTSGTNGMDRDQHARAGNFAVANGVAQADVDVI